MNDFATTKAEVKKILETEPNTRNSDEYLYYIHCRNHWVRDTEMYRALCNSEFRKSKGIAPFCSIERARRELQKMFLNLQSDEKIQKRREEQEEKYREAYGKGR